MYEPEIQQPELFHDIDDVLRISRNVIASLSDVAAALISKADSGQRNLSYTEFRKIRSCVDDLLEIQNRFAPAKLDWADVRHTRKMIDDLHQERANPPADPEPLDWDLVAQATSLVSHEAIASRFSIPLDQVRERIRVASQRIDHKVGSLIEAYK